MRAPEIRYHSWFVALYRLAGYASYTVQKDTRGKLLTESLLLLLFWPNRYNIAHILQPKDNSPLELYLGVLHGA